MDARPLPFRASALARANVLLGRAVAQQNGAVHDSEEEQKRRVKVRQSQQQQREHYRALLVKTLIPVLLPQSLDGGEQQQTRGQRCGEQERREEAVVLASDARAQRAAVVVEALHAEAAARAVAGARLPPDVARATVPLRDLASAVQQQAAPRPLAVRVDDEVGGDLAALRRDDLGIFYFRRRDDARVNVLDEDEEDESAEYRARHCRVQYDLNLRAFQPWEDERKTGCRECKYDEDDYSKTPHAVAPFHRSSWLVIPLPLLCGVHG
eukprot:TRINITY_DN51964_c3_g1_i1.p2 TRINITY_DN51964_c3_g1~~TRINITY_DN51964_c3_g1_i1.p2  ORF type:complete len:267 (+),score=-6.72 TRINITY_DN51964_c3_g1_i1:255-1055(+)